MSWDIELYERENGEQPVAEFIKGLPKKHQAKAIRSIELLAEFGPALMLPHARAIHGKEYQGLWELRVQFANDISRIFYFAPIGKTFVLLYGFIKKTNETPISELERAKRYRDDYLRRCTDE